MTFRDVCFVARLPHQRRASAMGGDPPQRRRCALRRQRRPGEAGQIRAAHWRRHDWVCPGRHQERNYGRKWCGLLERVAVCATADNFGFCIMHCVSEASSKKPAGEHCPMDPICSVGLQSSCGTNVEQQTLFLWFKSNIYACAEHCSSLTHPTLVPLHLVVSRSSIDRYQIVTEIQNEHLSAREKKMQTINEVRKSLPIYAFRQDLLNAIEDHQVDCIRERERLYRYNHFVMRMAYTCLNNNCKSTKRTRLPRSGKVRSVLDAVVKRYLRLNQTKIINVGCKKCDFIQQKNVVVVDTGIVIYQLCPITCVL